jgi:pullulanase
MEGNIILVEQQQIMNVYLEQERSLLIKLAQAVTLPCETVVVRDTVTQQTIAVQQVDSARLYHAVVVGNFQHVLSDHGDWNTGDEMTRLHCIHANLYQCTVTLPAGTYQYKVAFNDGWDGALPESNIYLIVPHDQTKVTFSFVPIDPKIAQPEVYDSINRPNVPLPTTSAGIQTDLLTVVLQDTPDITHLLQVVLADAQPHTVIPRNVLGSEAYQYTGDDLGNFYTHAATQFRVWAPTASDVQLLLYDTAERDLTKQVPCARGEQGTWTTTVHMDLQGWYYLYQVTIHDSTQQAVDPYVRAIAPNSTRGMIVDLSKTDPDAWADDQYVTLAHPVDAVIYETHVRDFSVDEHSGMVNKGKFLAFTERGTTGSDEIVTGIDSVRQLDVTHIHLLPIASFASIDETCNDQYNWGYDPRNYNVPEGAYASTAYGTARITELKQLVQSLHQEQIGVIMDVVYNHTFTTASSDFDKLVPQYYYRTDDEGNYTNGSGVSNELATERPMVQKFVCDSLYYLAREYHIDGFRFDLMALMSVETMKKISQDLHALNPGVLLYGEPWTGGQSALPPAQLLLKGQQRGLGVAVFNDDIRNGLVGSAFDRGSRGFASGAGDQVAIIKESVSGSIHSFANEPGETVNYISSHDNLTLWDKIAASNVEDSEADRIRMDKLAQAVVLTSQGIPFLQEGEEFLRTKDGNENSYNAGDAVNRLDWSRKKVYQDVFDYYTGLIHLRNQHPAFRLRSTQEIESQLSFLSSPANTLAFCLGEYANQDTWRKILVMYNPHTEDVTFTLPAGFWCIASADGKFFADITQQVAESLIVPRISCSILFQQ